MKFSPLLSLIVLLNAPVFGMGACTVSGHLDKGGVVIKYFKPLNGFGNFAMLSTVKADAAGHFNLSIPVSKPTTAKFFFGSKVVWLLLQPNESIFLTIKGVDQSDHAKGWLTVENKDKVGYEYYNQVYNLVPSSKFNGIRDLFASNRDKNAGQLVGLVKAEISRQTIWLDSLRNRNLVSQTYYDYIKYETDALLAAEACEASDRRYEGKSASLVDQRNTIKKAMFALVDPTDDKLRTATFAHPYYTSYLSYMLEKQSFRLDSANLLIDELPYIEAAPDVALKALLWGRSLVTYFNMSAGSYDYCLLEKKYIARFGKNEYTDYLDAKKVCDPKLAKAYTIIESNQTDFFVLLNTLPANKYYIDLWATWCVPCIQEFKHYDAALFSFFDKNNIKPLFISIDKAEDKVKWQQAVEKFNLKGYHLLASTELQKSIKDIVYDNGSVSIPRYLVVDSNKVLLLDDAKRPSDGSLQNQLVEAFKGSTPSKK